MFVTFNCSVCPLGYPWIAFSNHTSTHKTFVFYPPPSPTRSITQHNMATIADSFEDDGFLPTAVPPQSQSSPPMRDDSSVSSSGKQKIKRRPSTPPQEEKEEPSSPPPAPVKPKKATLMFSDESVKALRERVQLAQKQLRSESKKLDTAIKKIYNSKKITPEEFTKSRLAMNKASVLLNTIGSKFYENFPMQLQTATDEYVEAFNTVRRGIKKLSNEIDSVSKDTKDEQTRVRKLLFRVNLLDSLLSEDRKVIFYDKKAVEEHVGDGTSWYFDVNTCMPLDGPPEEASALVVEIDQAAKGLVVANADGPVDKVAGIVSDPVKDWVECSELRSRAKRVLTTVKGKVPPKDSVLIGSFPAASSSKEHMVCVGIPGLVSFRLRGVSQVPTPTSFIGVEEPPMRIKYVEVELAPLSVSKPVTLAAASSSSAQPTKEQKKVAADDKRKKMQELRKKLEKMEADVKTGAWDGGDEDDEEVDDEEGDEEDEEEDEEVATKKLIKQAKDAYNKKTEQPEDDEETEDDEEAPKPVPKAKPVRKQLLESKAVVRKPAAKKRPVEEDDGDEVAEEEEVEEVEPPVKRRKVAEVPVKKGKTAPAAKGKKGKAAPAAPAPKKRVVAEVVSEDEDVEEEDEDMETDEE